MKKSIVMLCVCVVALAALIAVLALTGEKEGGEGADAAASAEPTATAESYELFALTSDNMESISITRKDGEEILFKRDAEGNWSFAEGNNPVKQSDLSSMASTISVLKGTRKVSDGQGDLAEFGLDKPQAVAAAFYNDGTKAEISIGNPTPSGDSYYIMAEGKEGVYLAYKAGMERFLRARADYVDKAITLPALDTIQHIYIAEKDKPLVEFKMVSQTPAGGGDPIEIITMTSPLSNVGLYSQNFDTYFYQKVSAIKLGDIVDMAPADLSAYGLDAPVLELRFEGPDAAYHLTVGSDHDPDNAYVMTEGKPEVYLVSKDSLKPLMGVNPMGYTEAFISLVNIDIVDRVWIEESGSKNEIVLNREIVPATEEGKADETVLHPTINGTDVQEAAFKTFYRIVIALSYDAITEPMTPTGQPAVTITYEVNDGTDNVVDRYYDYDENFYLVEHKGIAKNLINKKAVSDLLASIPKAVEGVYNK